ncbi:hypothetical protein D3C79_996840 [compost metagenome]
MAEQMPRHVIIKAGTGCRTPDADKAPPVITTASFGIGKPIKPRQRTRKRAK